MTCSFVVCTTDRQLVFEIRDNIPALSVDPMKLFVPGYPACKPVYVDDKVAIFKAGSEDCGLRVYASAFTLALFSC